MEAVLINTLAAKNKLQDLTGNTMKLLARRLLLFLSLELNHSIIQRVKPRLGIKTGVHGQGGIFM